MIWESMVSRPTRVARNRKEPVLLMVAPITVSPSVFSEGMGSPVTIDSSTADIPATTIPSTGIFSPGRTTTMSSTATSSTGISISDPSRSTRAVFAWRPISFFNASEVRARARISIADPNTTKAVTTAVTSKKTSRSCSSGKNPGKSNATVEYSQAAEIPMAIRVFMFAERCLNADQAPVKNCEPE